MAEPAGDLLGRPAQRQELLHAPPEPRAAGELGRPRPPRVAVPGELGPPGPVAPPAAVPAHLARHGRGRPPEAARDGAERFAGAQPAADLLAIGDRQPERRTRRGRPRPLDLTVPAAERSRDQVRPPPRTRRGSPRRRRVPFGPPSHPSSVPARCTRVLRRSLETAVLASELSDPGAGSVCRRSWPSVDRLQFRPSTRQIAPDSWTAPPGLVIDKAGSQIREYHHPGS